MRYQDGLHHSVRAMMTAMDAELLGSIDLERVCVDDASVANRISTSVEHQYQHKVVQLDPHLYFWMV